MKRLITLILCSTFALNIWAQNETTEMKVDKKNMEKAIETLKNGGVILYPTDTIWGIGCDATNEEACQKISQIKNRPENKSFIILVDSVQMIEKYIPEFPDVCYDLVDLADKPLTIIYPNAKSTKS